MRQAVAILLLLVLTVTSIRPTLAAHYCQGTLRAVGLTSEGMEAACCGVMEEELPDGSALSDPLDRCCLTRVFEVATDDYASRQPEAPSTTSPVMPLFFPPASNGTPSARSLFTLHASAPGGKVLSAREILSLIRVARN
jgi:hypothetical protein